MKYLILIFVFSFAYLSIFAQKSLSWKQHVKVADKAYKAKEFADAATHYNSAWKKKTSKKDLIRKAAECYFKVRKYNKAAEAYENIKHDTSDPLTGLKYGRSLKQAGQYEKAVEEYVYFLNAYQENDKATVSAIVQNEIRGCEMALKQKAEGAEMNPVLVHLDGNVNTQEEEFAVIPFSDDIIYFASTMQGKAEIFRSQLIAGEWTKAVKPESFPKLGDKHFCNGSFSPDSHRFYFSLCDEFASHGAEDVNCKLFVISRGDSGWGKPEELREYVNMPKTSNTHPFVFHKDDKEYVLFSSNRKGGKGGMDIWYMSRKLDSDEMDFVLPKNAGSINTMGNEITPFFDQNSNELYFSSNGQVSLGGFDIFSAKANGMDFYSVKNLGMPWNSSADDYFYTKTNSGNQVFLTSNRMFGLQKITTIDDDIFVASQTGNTQVALTISGEIFDAADTKLNEVSVELYEKYASGNDRLLDAQIAETGDYSFGLLPGKSYFLQIYRVGFKERTVEFNTENGKPIEMVIVLEKVGDNIVEVASVFQTEKPENAKVMSITTPENPATNTVVQHQAAQDKFAATEAVKPDWENLSAPVASTSETKIATTSTYRESTYTDPVSASPETNYTTSTTHSTPVTTSPETSYTTSTTHSAPITTSPETSYSYNNTNTYSAPSSPPIETVAPIIHDSEITYLPVGEKFEVTSSAPRRAGKVYKVQIIAVKHFDPNHRRYDNVRHLARMDTERIIDRGLVRVLLAEFYTRDEALQLMHEARQYSVFEKAFIVKYIDGKRSGISY